MRTLRIEGRLRRSSSRAYPPAVAIDLCGALLAVAIAVPTPAGAQGAPLDRTWPAATTAPVVVRAPRMTVRIDVWDREAVRARGPAGARPLRIEATRSSPDGLIVDIESRGGRGDLSDTVFVTIPRRAPVSVESYWGAIVVVGAEGDVSLESYFEEVAYRGGAARVSVRGFHSEVHVEAPRARSIVAESGGGDVHVLTGSGQLRVESVRGDIEVRARGPLAEADIRSTGGSILLSASLAASAAVTLDTHHGSIDMELDPGAGARFRLETYLGAIENDLGPSSPARRRGPVRVNAVDFPLGDARALVVASTWRGDIRLRRRDQAPMPSPAARIPSPSR